jgi:hypothetical protein
LDNYGAQESQKAPTYIKNLKIESEALEVAAEKMQTDPKSDPLTTQQSSYNRDLKKKLKSMEDQFDSLQSTLAQKDSILENRRKEHQSFISTQIQHEISRKQTLISIEQDRKYSDNKETDILRSNFFFLLLQNFSA